MKVRTLTYYLLVLVALEALSFFGWRYPVLGVGAWVVGVACTFVLALRRPELALGVIIAELVLGGKGYLLSLPVGGADLSFRLGLFLAIFVAWTVQAVQKKNIWGSQWQFRWLWLIWVGIAVWASGVGVLRGNGLGAVFTDANAFLFLGLAPAFGLLRTREHLYSVLQWFVAAIIVLAAKTALVQGLFTHYPSTELVLLYKWVRDTGVGEVTYIIGHLYRVFFQSHVYGLLAFFVGIGLAVGQPKRRWQWLSVATAGAFVVVVSLSRSFWLGGASALGLAAASIIFWPPFRRGFVRTLGYSLLAVVAALVLFQWTLNFPGLWGGGGSGGTLVRARSDIQTESAASSRRELLPVITRAIFDHPITGSGFGTALTYTTKDPRVNTSGSAVGTSYTTTAFELGYHAFALQFGVVFFTIWLFVAIRFLLRLGTQLRLATADRPLVIGLWLGTFAVCVLHLTTPYLNHPLGIGFFLLLATAASLMQNSYARR